jgi:hypothetical protein
VVLRRQPDDDQHAYVQMILRGVAGYSRLMGVDAEGSLTSLQAEFMVESERVSIEATVDGLGPKMALETTRDCPAWT